ncbi:glycosyltransferase family 4 protein [Vibrio campbellii]|uniref:glycosyltransferase family 4 protein n=1 Tax=Vibrio campbellii TaxID=680 RepID=UPI00398A1682
MKRLPHYSWLMRRIIRRSQKTVFISPSYKARVLDEFSSIFEDKTKCVVIPNGIDDFWINRSLLPLRTKSERNSGTVLFVGRLNKTKRPELVFEVVQELRKLEPNYGYELKFVGIERSELLDYLSLKQLPDWVIVNGKTSNKSEIQSEYEKALCLLVPSYQETFGLVYLEALSNGCPVILCRTEGISGFFSDCKEIIELDSLSPKNIANKLLEIKEFRFDRSQISTQFSWEAYSNQMKTILRVK